MLVSVLLHLLFMDRYEAFTLPSLANKTTLEARLMLPKPKAKLTPRPGLTAAGVQVKPATEKVMPEPVAEPLPAPEPQPSTQEPTAPPPIDDAMTDPLLAPELPKEALPEAQPQVVPEALPSATLPVETLIAAGEEMPPVQATPALEPAPLAETEEQPAEYGKVATDFKVYMNGNAQPVGQASILYTVDQHHRYQLTWQVEATGLLAIAYPDLVQTSQGVRVATGLQPAQYAYRFGNKANKSYEAQFNWADKLLLLKSSKGEKQAPLPENTQDFLSFMYQFMFVPPLETMQLNMTNGKKVANYDYMFVGEETLPLKFGDVNTYHIQHSKPDSEDKTELWLALDYHYLPVKIKKTEKNGTVIEQIAIKLTTETLNQATETLNQETPLP